MHKTFQITTARVALEKVIQAISKQPALFQQVIASASLNPPARPSKEATQEEINHSYREVDNYNQQLRWHSLLEVEHCFYFC
jgi:hypothetical protein